MFFFFFFFCQYVDLSSPPLSQSEFGSIGRSFWSVCNVDVPQSILYNERYISSVHFFAKVMPHVCCIFTPTLCCYVVVCRFSYQFMMLLVGIDLTGVVMNWKSLDHAGHLGKHSLFFTSVCCFFDSMYFRKVACLVHC
jgi:hypothetical protein